MKDLIGQKIEYSVYGNLSERRVGDVTEYSHDGVFMYVTDENPKNGSPTHARRFRCGDVHVHDTKGKATVKAEDTTVDEDDDEQPRRRKKGTSRVATRESSRAEAAAATEHSAEATGEAVPPGAAVDDE